ncbi:MAG: hypothetical protein N2445_01770, partial [Acidobacteria bacterium]|nr:hypothetical protein [Acidobacteriota bacterium]
MERKIFVLFLGAVVFIFSLSIFCQDLLKTKDENKIDLPKGVERNWFSEVQKNIEKEEYNITYQEGVKSLDCGSFYQAPNRAQGFRTYFTEEGIKVVSRTEEEPSWEWGLSLQNQIEELNENVNIYVKENRIEFDRGWIKEWYINSPDGLE